MGFPTVKRLVRDLGIQAETAGRIRKLMAGERLPDDPGSYPATAGWVARCLNRPWDSELVMSAIAEELGSEVEAFDADNGEVIFYVGAGDTYVTTVACVRTTWGHRFVIADLGSLVNRFGGE